MKKIMVSHSSAETQKIGAALGKTLERGDIVALYGDLGAGKTAFVRGVAIGMGLPDEVSSPTFAIVNVYEGSPKLCHFDMYRVETWDGLYSCGYFDYLEDDAVLAVEWSENIEAAIPESALKVTIERTGNDDERLISLEGEFDNEAFVV